MLELQSRETLLVEQNRELKRLAAQHEGTILMYRQQLAALSGSASAFNIHTLEQEKYLEQYRAEIRSAQQTVFAFIEKPMIIDGSCERTTGGERGTNHGGDAEDA